MYILMGHISLVDHSVFRGPRELLGIRRIQIRVKDTVIPFRIRSRRTRDLYGRRKENKLWKYKYKNFYYIYPEFIQSFI